MPAGPALNGIWIFRRYKSRGLYHGLIGPQNGYGVRGSPKPNVWSVGLTRTGIGIAARRLHDRVRRRKYSVFGTICSYALDAIAVSAAFVLPGGIWVC